MLHNCKTALWRPPWPIFWAGTRNAPKLSSGYLLGPSSGLGREILQNCPLEASLAHFPGLAQKCSKTAFWRPPRPTFRAGPRNAPKFSSGDLLGQLSGLGREMLQNCPLEASWAHFPGWAQKCSKSALWTPPGRTFWAGTRNAPKLPSGDLLGQFSGLGREMLQNCPLDTSWAQVRGSAEKCSKTVFWKPHWPTFRSWPRNALKLPSGSLRGPLSWLGPEMLQNCPLETSWANFQGWAEKCSKTVLWRPPGPTFWAGLRNGPKLPSGGLLGTLSGLGTEMLQNCSLETS